MDHTTTIKYVDVAGVVVCVENSWIRECEVEVERFGPIREVGQYRIYTKDRTDMLFPGGLVGSGSYGTAYMCESVNETGRECVLKVMNDKSPIDRGGIGHAKYVEATMNAKVCNIVITKFFYGGRLQVMEQGTEAMESAIKHLATPMVFMKFVADVCKCMITHGLANPDMKLGNVIVVNECDNKQGPEFRLIDVDGIVAANFEKNVGMHKEKYGSTLPDVLFVEAASTYPVIANGDIQCPEMLIVQTWYASLVACVMYVQYYKHEEESYITKQVRRNLSHIGMEKYDWIKNGILSLDHPFVKIVMSASTEEIPVVIKECVSEFVKIFPKKVEAKEGVYEKYPYYDSSGIIRGCDLLWKRYYKRNHRGRYPVTDAEIVEASEEEGWEKDYEVYRKAFAKMKRAVFRTITKFEMSLPAST